MIDQTVWLAPKATSYVVVCEECAAEHGYLGAQVEGRLELERGHTACPARAGTRSASSARTATRSAYCRELGHTLPVPATVIVGAQWGDEGKGKIVDLLAQESDVVCRYQGGPNAGHTVIVAGETFKFRHLPSGILSGKVSVLGAGCVVDPAVLLDEIDDLESRGVSAEPLRISGNAHLIMPWHIVIDGASEKRLGKLQIGTTRRGIGPAYADKAARLGIRVQDLLDPKILRQKIEVALAEKNVWLERVYEQEPLELDDVASRYEGFAQRLRPFVADTSLLVDQRAQRRQERPARGRAGHAARPRPRHLSLRHLVEPDRRRGGDGDRDRADADRRGHRRLEGIRDARRRRAVPERDGRAAERGACASSARSSARSPAATAGRAGSTSSRSATPCA